MTYIVLSGAKINVGDFLITDRCKKLLRHLRPEHELIQLPHWEPLEPHLDVINAADAVIIMGGPGFQKRFYPGVYKLTENLDDIRVPIIPMGLGWKGFPGDEATLRAYRFSAESMRALRRVSREATWLSCRDYLTHEALRRNGIENVLMTGCPVWYDLDFLGAPLQRPESIEHLIFTPAQRPLYSEQSVQTLERLRELLPHATITCSFHRGIDHVDAFLSPAEAANNARIAAAARALGCEVVDASYALDSIAFYGDCDVHVGYRVHAHLHFLSQRQPSILIHEDGRGRGVSGALGVPGVDAFRQDLFSMISDLLGLQRVSDNIRTLLGGIRSEPHVPDQVIRLLRQEMDHGFARYAGLPDVIDAHYEVMKTFIHSLPG